MRPQHQNVSIFSSVQTQTQTLVVRFLSRVCVFGLTVGEVGRSEAVVHEDTVGFSHFQVDHVGSVFQGSDGVFVAHLLQAGAVHLNADTSREERSDTPVLLF